MKIYPWKVEKMRNGYGLVLEGNNSRCQMFKWMSLYYGFMTVKNAGHLDTSIELKRQDVQRACELWFDTWEE